MVKMETSLEGTQTTLWMASRSKMSAMIEASEYIATNEWGLLGRGEEG
jgi:hypothetical protein